MSYGWCYDDSGTVCSGSAQPGTRNLRDECDERIPELGDLGIYNCRPKRTSSRLSLHAEGRAWDAAFDPVDQTKLGTDLAAFFVKATQALGIQRVIVFDREWDSRPGERRWEDYTGPFHGNHVHVELCWPAARNLSRDQVAAALDEWWEDDAMTPEDFDRIREIVRTEALAAVREARDLDVLLTETEGTSSKQRSLKDLAVLTWRKVRD